MQRITIVDSLRHAPVRRLWALQAAFSAGDEVSYLVLAWSLASCAAQGATYLLAVQAVATVFVGAFSGRWSDRYVGTRIMGFVLALRATIIFALSGYCHEGAGLTYALIALIGGGAIARALYEPALQEVLPQAAGSEGLRHPTNSLIEATRKLAGIIVPFVAGRLIAQWGIAHVFLGSAFFFVLAYVALARFPRGPRRAIDARSYNLVDTWHLTRANPAARFAVLAMAITGGAWGLIYYVAFPLLVHQAFPTRVDAFGFLVSIYGASNFVSNVAMGFVRMNGSRRWMGIGFITMGAGFIAFANAHDLVGFSIGLALASAGGPIPDLAAYRIFQKYFEGKELAALYRLRMTITNLLMFFVSLLALTSPESLSPVWICNLSAACLAAVGLTTLFARRTGISTIHRLVARYIVWLPRIRRSRRASG